jgi:hypothetical protein
MIYVAVTRGVENMEADVMFCPICNEIACRAAHRDHLLHHV